MIRYKRNIFPSKKLPYKYLYSINSRNTIYGIHKYTNLTNVTKTALIVFIEDRIANNFVEYIELYQRENIEFNRVCVEIGEFICSPATILKSAYPLSVHKNNQRDLELTCIMNFFDMFIVSKIEKEDTVLNVYGFDYIISDLPCRQLIEFNLKYDS